MNTVEEVDRDSSPNALGSTARRVTVRLTTPTGQVGHFVISSVNAMFTGPETMVFAADKDGQITSWSDLWASRPYDEAGALEYLRTTPLEKIGSRDWEGS